MDSYRYYPSNRYINPYLNLANREYLNFYNPLNPYDTAYLNSIRKNDLLYKNYLAMSDPYIRAANTYPYYSYYKPELYRTPRAGTPPSVKNSYKYNESKKLDKANRQKPLLRSSYDDYISDQIEAEIAQLELMSKKKSTNNNNLKNNNNLNYNNTNNNNNNNNNQAMFNDYPNLNLNLNSNQNTQRNDFHNNNQNQNQQYNNYNNNNQNQNQQFNNYNNNNLNFDTNDYSQNDENSDLNKFSNVKPNLGDSDNFYVNNEGRLTQMKAAQPLKNPYVHDYLYSLSKQDEHPGYVEKYKDTQRRNVNNRPNPNETLKEFKKFKDSAGFGFDFLDPTRAKETNGQKLEKVNKRNEYAKYVKDRNVGIANKKNVYNPEINQYSLPNIKQNRLPPQNLRVGPSRFSN